MALTTKQNAVKKFESALAKLAKAFSEAAFARAEIGYAGGGDTVTDDDLRAAGSHIPDASTWQSGFAELGTVAESLTTGGANSIVAKITRAAKPTP